MGAAWGFLSGKFAGPDHRTNLGARPQQDFGLGPLYRFHLEVPGRFEESLRVSTELADADDQGNDHSSIASWYQHQLHAFHPELPPVDEQLPHHWTEHGP